MNSDSKALLVAGGLLGAAGIGAGVASLLLFSKTVPRRQGPDEEMAEKFGDKAQLEKSEKKMTPAKEWLLAQPLEDVFVPSRDGLKLHALVLPAEKPSRRVVILHHGFTGQAEDTAFHARFFHRQGYQVLLLDLRAHGRSEGQYVGFGILDRFDTSEWVKYCRLRFGQDAKIVLHGTSMGAATVLMSLGVPEVQRTVSAAIADCAFTSPSDIFSQVIKRDYHLPPAPILKVNGLYAKKVAGYRFDEYSTLEALEKNRVPVLFIHGKADSFVPPWMSEENYRACAAPKRLLLVDNAGHGNSVFENTPLYEQTELEFLARTLGRE